ncbi:amidoligase family protein [Halomonas sp. MCCC 1A17488]|uniref:Amidoligase family protein n=1 Tax=Billgrantia sulfidoxydans TaxID=2733484 RepID=A0ABX7W345_9GAMM|nr:MULTISPECIES: amidoligase family protein [Halomonas]MCE8016049.1 amidoligase family protein [Halomonas sp. MCCC 1A17488]MCG3239382.1 amidoligase family protein [Halomonas sp. MCCC 1A17488]QPP50688.1 amidoligase family protein [Halomonas sp. SS10-MC5]QTP54266.1 amidoligase family protein [Halomonas sulfidoxydans]
MLPQSPPEPLNVQGRTRRVGAEIEFAGLPPQQTGELVRNLFGGELKLVSPHRLRVEATRWGDFVIELDTQYAHPDARLLEALPRHDTEWERQRHQMRLDFHNKTRELIGDVVTGLVPTEIVCPPVPWNELAELDALFAALHAHGAKGTDASLLYGFGLHLNPEAASLEPEAILRHFRAFLLMAAWLRKEIDIDITREVLPHANPFPKHYALKVLDPDYAPDLDTLIADYISFNPTRNRELDLYPLFAHLCPDYPDELFRNNLIKPRPTYHYRLPNAQLSQRGWGAVVEWNRWVAVERLAADRKELDGRASRYVNLHTQSLMTRMVGRLRNWIKEVRSPS